MNKYVNCKDCKEQYDCERTYLGGCTDGKAWEETGLTKRFMGVRRFKTLSTAEKKEMERLTDEELIKVYEHCFCNQTDCEKCPCDDWGCGVGQSDILDLLKRQKAEIERLTKKRKYILANKVYTDSTLKKWSKEDLIEQIRILEHNWSCAERGLDIQAKNCEMLLKQAVKETAEKFAERLKEIADRKLELYKVRIVDIDDIDEILKEITDKN